MIDAVVLSDAGPGVGKNGFSQTDFEGRASLIVAVSFGYYVLCWFSSVFGIVSAYCFNPMCVVRICAWLCGAVLHRGFTFG